jgi:gas vesicle protein GvpL/GvpF
VSRPAPENLPLPRYEHSEPALATYVYGVLAADEAKGLPMMNGIDRGHSVTTLASNGLAAIVSRVPLDEFDERRLRENLTEMSWVERVARRHEEVLEAAAGAVTVIPMRLCSIYRDDAGVRDMLERENGPMHAALEALRGKAEWGVKAFRLPSASGAPRLEDVDTERPQTGADYLERQRRARQRRERADEALDALCETIHSALTAIAARAVLLAPQRPEVSGHAGEMLLNGAYLVDAIRHEDFHATVGQLAHECGSQGIEVHLTGPWPAYNFVPDAIGAPA